MTDLLDEVCAWVRGGSVAPDTAVLTDVVMSEDARLLGEAFSGEAGRKRLMVFARLTVLRPPVDHRLPAGEAQAYAQLRQGQDSIFAALVRYLDLHQDTLRSPPDDRPAEPRPSFPYAFAGGGPDADADTGDDRFTDPGSGWDAAGTVAGQ